MVSLWHWTHTPRPFNAGDAGDAAALDVAEVEAEADEGDVGVPCLRISVGQSTSRLRGKGGDGAGAAKVER